MFLKKKINESMNDYSRIATKIKEADAIIIGAGAGLSTSAGFTYSGERFRKYFGDMEEKYGFHDMYSGGFYNYKSLEEMWAFWSRYIFINRYIDIPKSVYNDLYELIKDKNYFVLTTNVDHCFQKAGFAKDKLFYTQGDYGLFQCSEPCHEETYDNETIVRDMLIDQGFEVSEKELIIPGPVKMKINSHLVPYCPHCGKPMSMNLRADSTFVEDAGWNKAASSYSAFKEANQNKKVLFIELGVGYNTPIIIKYPFWRYTHDWKDAFYVCLNKGEAAVPNEIRKKSICINEDIGQAIMQIKDAMQ